MSILIMYQFYYDYLKPKYGDKYTLLFTDTDSFCCNIQTEDVNFCWYSTFLLSHHQAYYGLVKFADTAYFADSTND